MKLRDTEFFQQITAVVAGLILVVASVASVAFVSIPVVLAGPPGESAHAGAPKPDWHPT
jgi:hypothetical protein